MKVRRNECHIKARHIYDDITFDLGILLDRHIRPDICRQVHDEVFLKITIAMLSKVE